MNTRRGLLIYAACCALAGLAAGGAWIYATGTFHPPIWGIVASSVLIGLACDPIGNTITRRLNRPARSRRRAHARPARKGA